MTVTREYVFFKTLLLLYPASYLRKFGKEMLITFEDMYQEKMLRDGEIGFTFWFSIFLDIIKSTFEQHRVALKKQGMKKYVNKTLHINRYNVIGTLLLLPFLSVLSIDLLARFAQDDITHYNRPLYLYLSHTVFYWTPILVIWVILFPTLAVLLNLIPLIQNIIKKHGSLFKLSFIKHNALTLTILAIGLGFLAIIKLHDFAPCIFHGLLRFGVGKLPYIFSYCKNA